MGKPDGVVQCVPEAGRVDRVDPLRAVRDVVAEEVVAVVCDLGHDLAEAERHDREVVTAQAQGREADQDARDRRERAGDDQHEPDRDVKAGRVRRHADAADVHVDVREVLRGEPRDRVRAHGVERDEAEIEQAGVAHDDVQAEGHHDEDHHRHARVDAREVAEDDQVEEVRLVDGVEHRDQEHPERDDPLPEREHVPGRDVEGDEDEGGDDQAERRRAGDRENEERRDRRRSPPASPAASSAASARAVLSRTA